ncbi:uncharacterized protein A4U43_C07F17790 [Asparagus officinalis]|uniref:Protein N-terminal glutamine amidohydrolase n=1 Tax=Asparagus officinalis TaxID=4686 RepID=A0A5P1EG56_ASPOF|nr:protein N-terminal glutamine amidohydrolase [Asparagus officinalis]ONK63681.1 uncharacterized protein A4U43_C07F17790 [Asparagus officinalis]
MGLADREGADLFVVFISNEEKRIPLWCQKASKTADGLVIWDYHVICIQSQNNNEGNAQFMVWDLDSSLPCPMPLKQYINEAILPPFSLNPRYSRLFRVVHAPILFQCFASDRSHMKDSLGNWISPPPVYKPIVAEDGTKNNLDEYIQMRASDIPSDVEALINGIYSNKYGVVINGTMLESFFTQIYQRRQFSTLLCQ